MMLTIILCIIYLLAGIGYYVTCKDRLKDGLLLKPWENKIVIFAIIVGVGVWLSALGLVYIITEIKFVLKKIRN